MRKDSVSYEEVDQKKYLDDNSQYTKSRTNRNSSLYKDIINNSELDDYSLASNAKKVDW